MEMVREIQGDKSAYLGSGEKIYTVTNVECKEYGRRFFSKKVYMDMVLCKWLEGDQDSWVLISDTDLEIFN